MVALHPQVGVEEWPLKFVVVEDANDLFCGESTDIAAQSAKVVFILVAAMSCKRR